MGEKLKIARKFYQFKYKCKFKTRAELEQYQREKIQKQLEYMTTHSPYYKQLELQAPYRLSQFPIVDKKEMMLHFNTMNTVGIDKDEALHIALESERTRDFEGKLNGVTVGLSSGTSGNRGIFLVSDEERATWAGGILAKLMPLRYLIKGAKVAFFMRANSNLYETVKSKQIQFKFFDMYHDLEGYVETLNTFKPHFLIAPPSVLIQLAKLQKQKKLCIEPYKIISVAEVLEDADKAYMLEHFKAEVIHQVYQCTEGFLGYTCDYGTMHLNEDVVIVEKEYLSENRFVPILADLERTSQPIIRYRLNDVLIESKEPCPCGSPHLAIERIEGREDDIFIFKGNVKEEVKVFADFIRRCLLFTEEVGDYKIIQESPEHVRVQLDPLTKSVEEGIRKEFEELATQFEFVMPELSFEAYSYDGVKKLKRIERRF